MYIYSCLLAKAPAGFPDPAVANGQEDVETRGRERQSLSMIMHLAHSFNHKRLESAARVFVHSASFGCNYLASQSGHTQYHICI